MVYYLKGYFMGKAEETRQYIIEKSALIFNKQGYAGTSINDITDAVNMTKGAIYGNFENKEIGRAHV